MTPSPASCDQALALRDTKGTRHKKREVSGHRTESMMDVYDLSLSEVTMPGGA